MTTIEGMGVRTSAARCISGRSALFALALGACEVIRPAAANNVEGAWSPLKPWPVIAVHAVLMPDGRVLTYGTKTTGQQTAIDTYDIWNPASGLDGGHLTLPNTSGTDIFCSSQLVLPGGGQVFVAGGDNWTGTSTTNTGNNNSNLVDYGNNTISRQANMNRPRWYSTSTTLLNGETYIQGGSGGTDRPEIRDVNGGFRLLTGANTSGLDFMYPRNFIAPDGRIFGFERDGRMYYVNTSGTGSVTTAGQFTGPTGTDSSAAMFRPGRILQFGGNTNGALIIDINGGSPSITSTQSLTARRRLVNATILADGKVVATGGSDVWNEMTGAIYTADIWNPATGTWTRGASATRARLYHSNAVLMPDASVLVLGGGAPGPQNNLNVEVYYPPYLYNGAGGLATRPVIDDAPSTIDVGETFEVRLGSSATISRVTLIKTTSASHSFNMEQRFVELTFRQSGDSLIAQAPTRATESPPGFYLLFVLNSAGTPSIAKIVRVPVAPVVNPAVTPVLVNPGAQSGAAGTPVSLQLSATDPNGDTIAYAGSGLPTGVFVNAVTGAITGTPTASGTFNVVVSATDGVNTDSESFVWTVAEGPSFILNTPPPPAPAVTGSSVTYTASVTGGAGIQYQWDFGDGTPPTAFSPSATVQHQFAAPGIYYVMVTARDAGGTLQTTTIVQRIHWPLTANRPAASSNLMFEDRATGADRFWVVNQDHNSVSVFNANTSLKQKTITVGTSPRSIALTPGGEVWVTNRDGPSISVIDPVGLTELRKISLPFASQPYGLIAGPTGGKMFVVLEGSGRLLKLDGVTGAIESSIGVGPRPRHLSMTGDGSRLYVSRFVTPPLPGESTASVQTQVGGVNVGGEIVQVNPATMTVVNTIVLRHSDKPDFENQGRGIPNYLGPAVISPDGRSAWVPSKQDNVKRGMLRDGLPLNFQNTVRAISSRIDLATGAENYASRIDHDNSGVATAIAYDPLGVYMFVALETSRQVAVVDVHGGHEVFRRGVGRAPQGVAVSADGSRLYVNNFLDRTVGVYDLTELLEEGVANLPLVTTQTAHGGEKLATEVLQGKRLFYDALDTRLARDAYVSCASCHNDGGHDGRVWDLTGFGEGLRNTVSLRGRAGAHGFLHWSNNFDEVQDFEGQIRALSGGTGLMTNAQFNTGTRSQPLGDPKAGVSADLDALATYVKSLGSFPSSPLRNADGSLTSAATAGKTLFVSKNCGSCHGGAPFTTSGSNNPEDIGTINADSGTRLGGPLTGIDIPTLRDAWATAPYLHRGSAATLSDAIAAHEGITLTAGELANLAAYVAEIGGQEPAPGGGGGGTPNTGTGLQGRYFNNPTLSGAPVLSRVEAVNFGWSTASPGPGVNSDQFSVRWSGMVEASATGNFQFQTRANDGVRLWINGILVIDDWNNHSSTVDRTTASIALAKNQRYSVVLEYYENTGAATAKLRWLRPGTTTFGSVPATRLYAN
jgi:YVTN family beta-propeller protein